MTEVNHIHATGNVDAIPADGRRYWLVPGPRARAERTQCNCHPETCGHGGFTLFLDDQWITSGIEADMIKLADAVNAVGAPGTDQPFGIIDPDYARIFTIARAIAWSEGYALAAHGSFTRDLDLIAFPWAERVCEPAQLARRIAHAAELRTHAQDPSQRPHGRLVWTLNLSGFGDPRWVDLGVFAAPVRNACPHPGCTQTDGAPCTFAQCPRRNAEGASR